MARAKNFFHGTKAELKVGDHVVPAVVHGGVSHWGTTGDYKGQPSRENAYATTDWRTANSFAEHAAQFSGDDLIGHVYPVEPVEKPRKGAYTSLKEYLAPAWRVTGPPQYSPAPKKGHYRQERLPLDWNRVAKQHAYNADLALSKTWQTYGAQHPLTDQAQRVNDAAWDTYNKNMALEPQHRMKSRQFNKAEPKEKKTPQVKGQMRLF